MKQLLVAFILAFIVEKAPPGRPMMIPEAQETEAAAMARYTSIAEDTATVVMEEEPIWRGDQGKIRTAATLGSLMLHESGFRKDVDEGVGSMSKGDQGRSVCLLQINVGTGRTRSWNSLKNRWAVPSDPESEVIQGWNAEELLQDRKRCIRTGYRLAKNSFGACRARPIDEWLKAYASGSCEKGLESSRKRMNTAIMYFNLHQPAWKDADLLPAQVD